MKSGRVLGLLTGGLVIGLAIGLFYARVISPLVYSDTAPVSLRADAKDQYRMLVAAAFSADGDLGRAQARLALLQDASPVRALSIQAQQVVARGGPSADARKLALLAVSLGKGPAAATPSPLPAPPTAAQLSLQQPTLAATRIPSPTTAPTAIYILKKTTPVCDPSLGRSIIKVQVRDRNGLGVAGVQAQVSWASGQDAFYTGLMPQEGPGYADFIMTPGVVYTLRVVGAGAPVENLSAASCSGPTGSPSQAEAGYPGSILLEFGEP